MNTQTVTIEVAPQVAATLLSLQQKAEVQGITLEKLLNHLATNVNWTQIVAPKHTKTPQEKAREFESWAYSHAPSSKVLVDDSRESIYGDDLR